MSYHASSFGDFKCDHCRYIVSAAHMLSGVNNRNHCPYCLWSCHLDLFEAGDRLSACKGQMKAIGLTMKKSRNKYQLKSRGELMLVHECMGCGAMSINRIAADDDPDSILDIFHESFSLGTSIQTKCQDQGILLLKDLDAVSIQLFGKSVNIPVISWG
jgi:hypothetical protein